MAAQFLRLRLQLVINSFRRSPWEVVGLLFGIGYAIVLAVVAMAGFIGLRSVEVGLARDFTVIAGSLLFLGFLLLPLVFCIDDPMDPRAFSVFGLPDRQLAYGLLLAALVSFPVVALAFVSIGPIVAFSRGFWPVLLGIISVAIIVVTGALMLRVMGAVAGILLRTRRARETCAVLGIVAVVLASPALILFASTGWGYNGLSALTDSADMLSWTPLGAAWSISGAAANGNGGTAVLKLIIALAYIGALWLAWHALVRRSQKPVRQTGVLIPAPGLGWFERLSWGPTGAVAARSITYWARDPRYRTSLAIIPIVPIVMLVPLAFAGLPVNTLALVPLPVMCLFLGWVLHNDVSLDNTAIWLHLASGVKGRADRMGRVFPALLVGVPLVLLGAPISIALFGDWGALAPLIGFSISILLTGIGLSSYASARYPYPAVRPGDSPFAQPQSASAMGGVVQTILFLVTVVICAPVALLAVADFTSDSDWHWDALIVGVALGMVMLTLGVLMGGRAFERRIPEILAAAMRN